MRVRQSTLKTWMKCPLIVKFEQVDGLQRLYSGSSVYGSIIHDCVLWMEVHQDVEGAVARFKGFWADPSTLIDVNTGQGYRVDYYVRGTNWRKFMESGERILRNWWSVIQWDSDLTLAREHSFEVPVGTQGNTLHGTVDKLAVRYRAKEDQWVLLISDYKTNKKTPTYGYLEEDLQFSAYAYATTRPEFWKGLPDGLYEKYRDLERRGEWVQLETGGVPKRMDAGVRTERHYNRVAMAVDAMAESIAMRIFVPTISGDTCRYCDYRKPCGLPELDDEGNPVP